MRSFSHWLEEASPAESIDFYRELATSHAREGGSVGASILSLIKKDDLRGLCDFEMNYMMSGLTAHAVRHCRQALAFFTKLEHLDIGVDKREVALAKFLEAETSCKATNQLLIERRRGTVSFRPAVESALVQAQRKVARVLGEIPKLADLNFRFGPGATTGVKRKDSSPRSKLAESIQCSEDLLPMASALLGEMPMLVDIHEKRRASAKVVATARSELLDLELQAETWLGPNPTDEVEEEVAAWVLKRKQEINQKAWFSCRTISRREGVVSDEGDSYCSIAFDEWVQVPVVVRPAKLGFVPKNAKTYRTVCVEPSLNVMFQLGVGEYLAQRLASVGVDIRDQTPNQRRALEGSLTGESATLDLSSASDTISRELVFELLPLDWATFLARGRSTKVILPGGKEICQEKFSSMGNGFTFPLETLIFWALAASCCSSESDVTVYGDDIIVPSDRYLLTTEVLEAAGFSVNAKKSFSSGPFRESCGKDYFSGSDVRPYYPKGWVSAQTLFVLHNHYVRHGDTERAQWVASHLHPSLLLYGPDGYGDGHLLGDHPRKTKSKYTARGYGGYFFDTLTVKARRDVVPLQGDYVLPSYTVYQRGQAARENLLLSRKDVDVLLSGCEALSATAVRLGVLRSHRMVLEAPLAIPEWDGVKALSLPGEDGYKRVSIYTLGD